MHAVRIGALALVVVSLFLAGCGSNTPTTAASPSPTPTQSPRTLTFKLNACAEPLTCDPLDEVKSSGAASKFGQGTVQIDVKTYGYTITVTVTGLTPNTKHLLNFHFGSCGSPDRSPPFDQIEVAVADATGSLTSVITRNGLYLVPGNGRIVTVHGDDPKRRETHIACTDLSN